MMINVYMDCHDKFGIKNKAIMYNLGIIIAAAKMPYILMGDWQLTPEELASVDWLNTIDVYIVAPDEVTCMLKNRNTSGSIIDYAVVSNWLVPIVKYINGLRTMLHSRRINMWRWLLKSRVPLLPKIGYVGQGAFPTKDPSALAMTIVVDPTRASWPSLSISMLKG